MRISTVITPEVGGHGADFSFRSVNLHRLGHHTSPVSMLDEFRVRGASFGPHPHAGVSAVTYVLRDSQGSLRSRDSIGNDVVVGPGGIVWTQAAHGLVHHEFPTQHGKELHGLQFFVDLQACNKLTDPRVWWLDGGDVPVWRSKTDDCVQVVVGAFGGVTSPLKPVEPFTLLDVELKKHLTLSVAPDQIGVLYVLSGELSLKTGAEMQTLIAGQALVVSGGGELHIIAAHMARLAYLSGARIDEPRIAAGPFLMNDQAQIDDAVRRFRRGEMGHLG